MRAEANNVNFIVTWGCRNGTEECRCHRPFFTKVEATLSASFAMARRIAIR